MHLLMTTRVMEPDGSLGAKTRELDVKKTSSQHVEHWRERWADLQNEALASAGVAQTVDHRSHTRRGLKTEPTIHLGAAATAMERRDQETDRGNLNRKIHEYNAEIQDLALLKEVRTKLEGQLNEVKAEQQWQGDTVIFDLGEPASEQERSVLEKQFKQEEEWESGPSKDFEFEV